MKQNRHLVSGNHIEDVSQSSSSTYLNSSVSAVLKTVERTVTVGDLGRTWVMGLNEGLKK